MNTPERLHELADLLGHAADALALFAHHAKHRTRALDDTQRTARELAMSLLPEYEPVANGGGFEIRHLRHAAASSLLRLAALARTDGATSLADGAAASVLAHELLSAANALRIQAAGLE